MRSITSFDLQYAHRFLNFQGEAQYLHGHTGVLTIEVEDTIEHGVNMVFPCNEIRKTASEVLKNFDHALSLREDDPLLPAILAVSDAQGIRNGAPSNRMKGAPVKTDLITCYPDCRLVVTKETLTTEGMIKIGGALRGGTLIVAAISFRPRRSAGALVKTLLICHRVSPWVFNAFTSAGWQWPNAVTAMPPAKSTYSLPC